MDYRIDVPGGEDAIQRRRIADVGAYELEFRARYKLADAFQHRSLGVREVVDDKQSIAFTGEFDASVCADETQSAGGQYSHREP